MFCRIAKIVTWVYIRLIFRFQVIGSENIPKKGGAVLCSNHMSNYDPVAVVAGMKRMPHYLAKKELFETPFVSWVVRHLKAFPIDRSQTDMTAFKTAVSLLKSGEIVGIFAQGTRVKEGEAKEAKAGVALFALKAQVPVIPVCITGSYKLFSRVTVHYGEPITLEEYRGKRVKTEQLSEIAESIMEKINEMKRQEVS